MVQQIKELEAITGLSRSFAELFEYPEPALVAISKEVDPRITKIMTAKKVAHISEILSMDLSDSQLDRIVEKIIERYYYWTLSEFNMLLDYFEQRKIYGKLDYIQFMETVQEFAHLRLEAGAISRSKEEHKDNEVSRDIMIGIYKTTIDKLVEASKVPPLSQKEKNRLIAEEQAEKEAELFRRYPEAFTGNGGD